MQTKDWHLSRPRLLPATNEEWARSKVIHSSTSPLTRSSVRSWRVRMAPEQTERLRSSLALWHRYAPSATARAYAWRFRSARVALCRVVLRCVALRCAVSRCVALCRVVLCRIQLCRAASRRARTCMHAREHGCACRFDLTWTRRCERLRKRQRRIGAGSMHIV